MIYMVTANFQIEAGSADEACSDVRDIMLDRNNGVAFIVTPQSDDGTFYHEHHTHVFVPPRTQH